ncbi:hypothetical protein PTKIN_Ptkin05aG0098000 [Pterospermum kingtungense]
MFGGRLHSLAYISFHFLQLVHLAASANDNSTCTPSSCGNIHNISYPFRLRGDPSNCANHSYELVCEQNNLTALYLYSGKYHVQAINYNNYTIRLVDAGVHKDNCSYSLTLSNFSSKDAFIWYNYKWGKSDYKPELTRSVVFLSCLNPVKSSSFNVDASPCKNGDCLSNSSLFRSRMYYYAVSGPMTVSDVKDLCRVELITMTSLLPVRGGKNISYMEIYSSLVYGFELSFFQYRCGN